MTKETNGFRNLENRVWGQRHRHLHSKMKIMSQNQSYWKYKDHSAIILEPTEAQPELYGSAKQGPFTICDRFSFFCCPIKLFRIQNNGMPLYCSLRTELLPRAAQEE